MSTLNIFSLEGKNNHPVATFYLCFLSKTYL